MKKVIFLILFLPLRAHGQVVDNFESGTTASWVFSNAGRWSADPNSIAGNFSLHHIFDNPEAGTDQAGMPIKNLHPDEDTVRWSFLIRHGYDPSSSNNWCVFLTSDSEPALMLPGGGMKGFAVGVDLTGSDDSLRLWKIDGPSIVKVAGSKINWQNDVGMSNAVRIITERSPAGEWNITVLRMNGQVMDMFKGSDKALFAPEWFGIFYKYSSTRDRLLWADDISIEGLFYEDKQAPSVSGIKVTGERSLELSFSEEITGNILQPANVLLNSIESNPVVVKKSSLVYLLSFASPFINKAPNNILLKRICDKSGNCVENSGITFIPVFPEPGDAVITEIMADPLPVVSLPPSEYIEITNRTNLSLNLKNWKLSSESRTELIPEVIIGPGSRLIICPAGDTNSFKGFGLTAGLKQFPSLNDSRMIITLSDSSGNLIHGIEYNEKWYGQQLKSEGGWALEMIDEDFPFNNEGNWSASAARKGGTPGQENSVSGSDPDRNFRGIINVFPVDSVTVNVRFSEYVPTADLEDFVINNGESIKTISREDQLCNSFKLGLNEMLKPGTIYKLEVNGLTDFAGNMVEKYSFDFGLPEISEKGDIIFNELLFNPFPGDPDYLELFNNSGKIVDASKLYLVSVSMAADTSSLIQLSEEQRCILPGGFYAVTTDREKIIKRYFSADPDFIFRVSSLPSMNDESGHLVLFNRELDIIDEVQYDDGMHYRLIDNTEGISLEKVSPESSSAGRQSWHSASELSGWGTPGARNSSSLQDNDAPDEMTFSSTKISPNNDSYEDFLVIGFHMNGNGNVISVTIFDETGSLVRKLSDRLLAGPEAELIWDGSTDDGTLVRTGIYIVFIEMYNSSGKIRKWKKVCTVIRSD